MKNQEIQLKQADLKKAEEKIKKRKFRKNLPVVIHENSELFHLYKDGRKEKIKV